MDVVELGAEPMGVGVRTGPLHVHTQAHQQVLSSQIWGFPIALGF